MDSRKRKFGTLGLGRRVRARVDPEPDLADEDEFSDDSVQPDEPDAEDSQDISAEEPGNESEEDPVRTPASPSRRQHRTLSNKPGQSLSISATSGEEEEEDDDDDNDVIDTSAISFGALARAQASLRRKETATTRQSSNSSRDVERQQHPTREGGAGARKPRPVRTIKHAPQ